MIKGLLMRCLPKGRTLVTAVPYGWLLLFFLLPFFFVLKISFTEPDIAQPPYTQIVQQEENKTIITLNTGKYHTILDEAKAFAETSWSEAASNSQYIISYWNSLKLALITTVLCLIIGYPIAYNIARSDEATRNTLLMLVMLPFWTSFLLRVYAWIGILKDNGVLNNILMTLGIINEPIPLLYNQFSVIVGMVYSYLPFMILPLFSHLVKLDGRLLEAAADLGAKPWDAFFKITLPLSKGGMIAGSMMVFIPAVGEYVIPELLGGGEVLMIGKRLMDDFGANMDWPQASAVTVIMMILLIAPIIWFHRFEAKQMEAGKS
ncbi:putrescine transport system permease protein [Chitinivorax tropicus]|uniref:Putrescine transport system permease protein n=1 Tax=Chitinivorax tropicus TaxID=714531 RepID=A0A840MU52_9PROT|nr:ABC transporter permease subunit [Chitinivorax tropicus]MBB5019896.1 putrescine transport system permease protein [Chitinivorax tropicus]